jgi:hypothetical protein
MAFLGMRGTGDWGDDERPLNWREMILRLYPNGMAPLTAIMSKMGSEKVDDPQFHWWTKKLSIQAGAVTGVYVDSSLSTAYVSGGVTGDQLYIKMAAALIGEIRVGHQVLLRDASDLTVDVNAKVVGRFVNGDSSYALVKLLEDDDNSTSGDLSDCDRILIAGNVNAEGAAMPDAIAYDPTKWYNYTQIFRTPLEITRTAMRTKLRTTDAYIEAKREALEYHSIEMEKAFLFGVPTETIGDNGKKERTTLGLIPAIRGGYTGHGGSAGTVSDYISSSSYSGQSWLQGGEHWLDTQLAEMFKYGKREKLAFCGDGALLALNRIVKNGGDYMFNPTTKSYGISVVEWVTPLGKINLVTHPLFSQETTMNNTMVVYEPENLKYRFIDDTTFYNDDMKKNTGWTRRDGLKEEFLTEAGLEYHHPLGWGYLTGLGSDNTA